MNRSMAVALSALTLAVAGMAAGAVALPGKHQVHSNDIKRNAVKEQKLSPKVRDKLNAQGLTQAGAEGPAGEPGSTPGIAYQVVRETSVTNSENPIKNVIAHCPSGFKVVGGGHLTTAAQNVPRSIATTDEAGWEVRATNMADPATTEPWSVTAMAICVEAIE